MQPTVPKPMDMTAAEALLKEAKQILDRLGVAFFCAMVLVWAP